GCRHPEGPGYGDRYEVRNRRGDGRWWLVPGLREQSASGDAALDGPRHLQLDREPVRARHARGHHRGGWLHDPGRGGVRHLRPKPRGERPGAGPGSRRGRTLTRPRRRPRRWRRTVEELRTARWISTA